MVGSGEVGDGSGSTSRFDVVDLKKDKPVLPGVGGLAGRRGRSPPGRRGAGAGRRRARPSRNGNGPSGDDWCNPSGRRLGTAPTTDTDYPLVDALLWVKQPGDSDGACGGGAPEAGQ